MSWGSRIRSFTSSLSVRLFFWVALSAVTLFTVDEVLSTRLWSAALEEQAKRDARQAGDLLKWGLVDAMCRNERSRISEMIRRMGSEQGVEAVRVYDKTGRIAFSSRSEEVGTMAPREAEVCVACHRPDGSLVPLARVERSRIRPRPGGRGKVLGLMVPVENQEGCSQAACHVHPADQAVLGVVDVEISLDAMETALAASRRRHFGLAAGIAVLLALLIGGIMYRAVYLPTRRLREGAEALGRGNLDVQIRLSRADELGLLADSFNRMARRLRVANEELREWSRTLEERVEEKTREIRQMTRQMVQVEKTASLGRLAATVAHELNNPLAGIVAYAKLVERRLQRRLPPDEERERILRDLALIREESLRCGGIVKDLLTYARETKPTLEEAPLHEVVKRTLRLARHHFELAGVEVRPELRLEDDRIVCDPHRLEQALLALVVNAVEAMPGGGILTVGTRQGPSEETVILEVADTGVGIPPEVQERIFEPFFSTKEETKGVGLGLAVVQGIVRRHGGRILVRSTPGEGTVFTIELPRQPSEQDAEVADFLKPVLATPER